MVLHASVYLGAACVIVPKFDFVHVLDLIVSQKISILYFVPPSRFTCPSSTTPSLIGDGQWSF